MCPGMSSPAWRGPEWVPKGSILDLQVVYLPWKGPKMGPFLDPFLEVQMTCLQLVFIPHIPCTPKGAYSRDMGWDDHRVSRGWIPCFGPSKRGRNRGTEWVHLRTPTPSL